MTPKNNNSFFCPDDHIKKLHDYQWPDVWDHSTLFQPQDNLFNTARNSCNGHTIHAVREKARALERVKLGVDEKLLRKYKTTLNEQKKRFF